MGMPPHLDLRQALISSLPKVIEVLDYEHQMVAKEYLLKLVTQQELWVQAYTPQYDKITAGMMINNKLPQGENSDHPKEKEVLKG